MSSAADLKFLHHLLQPPSGTSNRKRHWNDKLASAADLKFLQHLQQAHLRIFKSKAALES
jgi:hypothetical protein